MKLAIITPAFSKHLPLLEISVESVDRYVSPEIKQYVVVSRGEYHLFRHLNGSRRSVVIAEDILLPRWFFRLPVLVKGREVWLAGWHRMVRGWIMQQVLKLCAPEITNADVFLFLDTDVFFIRPFTLGKVVREGRVRLLRVPGRAAQLTTHARWHRTAAKMLGLAPCDYYGADFIGNTITWRRDVSLEQRARIAAVGGADWVSTITRQSHFSEYILYGVFVQEVIGPEDMRHEATSDEICLDSWYFMDGGGDHIQLLAERLRPNHIAVNIQSNLGLTIAEFRKLVDAAVSIAGTASQSVEPKTG